MNLDRLQKTLPAYSIERELGGGGMSQVFLATEQALGRRIVIKLLSEELASGVSGDRFKREIQVVAQLQHPNIVPLLAAGEVDGLPFYTMPFVDGESLRARIARMGELAVNEAVRLLRDVARALEYAHQHGVIHRDIKPDNVLVSGDYALVTDFGVNKAISAARTNADGTLTNVGVAVGTPAYMAPEQAAGDPAVDHRADVYAFGCVAYEVLAGHPPFVGNSAHQLIAAHISSTPASLRERRPNVPESLAVLVMQCLEKRAADRPQSARELVQALDAVGTPGTGTLVREAKVPTRRGMATAIAATMAVAAVVAVVLFTRRPRDTTIDESLVTVLPFRVSSTDASLRYLREGMVDLVAAKLTGAYRAVDARTVLAAWRRDGGNESTDLPEQDGLRIARTLSSARLLQGELVSSGSQVALSASLIDTRNGNARGRARVQGEPSALALLVDSLVSRLLVMDAGGDEQQSVALAGTPVGALQEYLAGQRAYRAARFDEAVTHFANAIDADSSFPQPALGLVLAGIWTLDPRSRQAQLLAAARRDKLSVRDQALLDVVSSDGTSTCRDRLRNEEKAVARTRDVAELWAELGETLLHCGQAMGVEDAFPRALAAFQKAVAIDSGYAPAWEHIPHLHLMLGDTAQAKATFEIYARTDPDLAPQWRYVMFADSAERERTVEGLANAKTVYFSILGGILGPLIIVSPRQMYLSERALAAIRKRAVTEADRQQLLDAERVLALNLGQPARAARVARSLTGYSTEQRIGDWLFHDGDSSLAAGARVAIDRETSAFPGADREGGWIHKKLLAGMYDAAAGRVDGAAAAATAIRNLRPATPAAAGTAQRAALLLDAQHAVLANSPSARTLVAGADSMLREGPPGTMLRSAGNLLIARLWERLGDTERAYAASQRVYYEPTFPRFWSTYKLERGRLAALSGHTEDAIHMYREYLEIRYNPEPALRPHVESIRRELARLERTSAGR